MPAISGSRSAAAAILGRGPKAGITASRPSSDIRSAAAAIPRTAPKVDRASRNFADGGVPTALVAFAARAFDSRACARARA